MHRSRLFLLPTRYLRLPVVCLHVDRRLARSGDDQVDDGGPGVDDNERPLQRLPCGINGF